jgi:tight adherence protein B
VSSSLIIRFFLLVAIFASVFLFSQVMLRATAESRSRSRAINTRLRMLQQGDSQAKIISRLRKNDPTRISNLPGFGNTLAREFSRLLLMSSVPLTVSQVFLALVLGYVALLLLASSLAWTAGYALTGGVLLLIVVAVAAIAFMIPFLALSFIAQRRRKRMQEQFPVALDIFVRALRSGHPVASAIELLTEEMEDPIGSEFGLVADEVTYGADLTSALHNMAERWDLDDIRMFVVSLSVQNETGGNLAEILENLAAVIRARAQMYMKVRSLSSEGRMTGWLLTALPIFTFVSLFVSNPKFYLDVAKDPIFYIGFPLLIGWYLVGVIAIRKMVNLKV